MSLLLRQPPGPASRHRTRALALLLVACGSATTLAAPLAPMRAPRPAEPKGFSRSFAASPLERACGSDIDGLAQAFAAAAEHAATTGLVPQPTPHSVDTGGIAVLEDDGTFFFTDKNGNANLDVAAVGRAFYRTHGDDYDQIAVWLTTGLSNWLGSPTALAAAWPIRNQVTGIGLDTVTYNPLLGLPPRLQTVLTMNGLQRYPDDPAQDVSGLPHYITQDVLAHEFGHQWLAYVQVQTPDGPSTVLLGRALQHWSFFFDSDGSVMEGPDWVAQGPDTFSSLPPITRYGPLDQYLMGLRAPEEMDSLTVLSDTANYTPPGPYVPFSDPNEFITMRGPSQKFGIEDVVAANGPRLPAAADAPHDLRLAFVLVVPRGTSATSADLAKVQGIRSAFPTTVQQYTQSRLSVDCTLDSHLGRVVLEHTPLPDTEIPGVARPVSMRATMAGGGVPIGIDPAGTTLSWRVPPNLAWTTVPMSAAGTDSFVASLPGVASGQTIEYRFHAQSDLGGLQGDLPDPSQPPFSSRTGPDVTPPELTHWPQPTQALERLPQSLLARVRDNLGPAGLDAVWCEYSVDGGPLQVLPASSAGSDSFVVALGAGVPRGGAIAYRFAARDRAAAANVGYSNAGFDTLRIGYDVLDNFWGGPLWTHGAVRFNRRDEWHPVEDAAFPAGSGAWHCGLDSLPYGPYQDAALNSPLVFNITAGCALTFMHHFDLEQASPTRALDGARVEIEVGNGPWLVANPDSAYTHEMVESDQGFAQNSPCWSGSREGWHGERFDLSAYAPGPVRVRFRMSTDLFVGHAGWWIDDVRFHFPQQPTTGVGGPASGPLALGMPWPNPAASALRQSLRLPSAARVDWALFDLAGRRVATLASGPRAAGVHELQAALPRTLARGLYFSRISVDGKALAAMRVAIVR